MKVKVNISKSDYFKAFKFAAMRIEAYKRAFVLTLIIIPVFFVMFAFAYSVQYHTTFKFVLTSFVFGIVFDIAILYLIKWGVLKKLQYEKPKAAGERVVEINEKGVNITSQGISGSISWELIAGIEYDKRHIYVFTSAMNAIIVPKKAFDKAKDAEEFFDKCSQYLKAADNAKTAQ